MTDILRTEGPVNQEDPTPETVSMRWGVRIVALMFVASLATLGMSEYFGMAETMRVAAESARGFGYALLAVMGLERGLSKRS